MSTTNIHLQYILTVKKRDFIDFLKKSIISMKTSISNFSFNF